MLEFVGTTRCGTQAAEVSQQSQGAAWLLITLKQRAEEKRKISVAIIRAPAVCKLRIDASNGVDMWETVTMLRVLEEAIVDRCFDQASLISCGVFKSPVMCCCNGYVTFVVNKHTTG